eukprot:m.45817 g.45817  ORF g.45817 m.45817 type:complete len:239 (+) comp10296_c0_seq4:70-786(+)
MDGDGHGRRDTNATIVKDAPRKSESQPDLPLRKASNERRASFPTLMIPQTIASEFSQSPLKDVPSDSIEARLEQMTVTESTHASVAQSDLRAREPRWKDAGFETELNDMEHDLEKLRGDFEGGRMQAFGPNASEIFKELEALWGAQYELFREHIDLESQFADPGDVQSEGPAFESTINRLMELQGGAFEEYLGADGVTDTITKLNGFCQQLNNFPMSDIMKARDTEPGISPVPKSHTS